MTEAKLGDLMLLALKMEEETYYMPKISMHFLEAEMNCPLEFPKVFATRFKLLTSKSKRY